MEPVQRLRQLKGLASTWKANRFGAKRAPKPSWGWRRKAAHVDQFDDPAYQHGYPPVR